MIRIKALAGAALVALAIAVAGCGGSGSSSTPAVNPNAAEVSPAGDIPDNQAFVAYQPPAAGFSVTVPEGWARSSTPDGVQFTDKLNSVTVSSTKAPALTQANAQSSEVAALAKSVQGFANPQVSTVKRKAGSAVLITYEAQGKLDPVTGKSTTNAVERYIFSKGGERATLILSGPKGADNVDPWRTISDSLKWTG